MYETQLLFSSFPRRRGSRSLACNWIPAYAGMTLERYAVFPFLSVGSAYTTWNWLSFVRN